MGQPMRRLALMLIIVYQHTISRLLPPACRFWPTCSRYAYEAIDRYGVCQGSWMTLCRLARCHPFNPGGYDPVR
jgi:putative membrane protein insertion efficiency factor